MKAQYFEQGYYQWHDWQLLAISQVYNINCQSPKFRQRDCKITMAEFIDFEVEVSDTEKAKDDEDEICCGNSLNSFINYSSSDSDGEKTNEESFYRKFNDMETSVNEILRQEYDQSIQDMDDIDLSNLCESSKEEGEID